MPPSSTSWPEVPAFKPPPRARPLSAYLLSFLAALLAGALALIIGCAGEPPHTAGDTTVAAAIPADSAAGADRTPHDSGATSAPLAPGATPGGTAPGVPRPGANIEAPKPGTTTRPSGASPQGRAPTRADVDRLYAEARALAKPDGCQEDAECRTAAAGWRGCGGPSEHLVYCPRTTDVARLTSVLARLERTEREYNRVNQIGSTCEYRSPPAVEAIGGRCRAVTVDR